MEIALTFCASFAFVFLKAFQHGVYQVGTSSRLNLPYAKGPSSWSHTFCITYKNGKRTLCTIWKGKPWADRSKLK